MKKPFRRGVAMLGLVLLLGLSESLAAQHEVKPGVEPWPIKTSVPAGMDVSHGTSISYADLVELNDPPGVRKNDRRYQAARIPEFTNALGVKEGDILTITAWLHLVAGENDGDYHIQISDSQDSQASCLIVEVPNPDPHFQKVRDFIKAKLLRGGDPSPRGSLMQHPPYVQVTGQLFYDDAHVGDPPRGKKGCKAATLWELHPVMDLKFVQP